MATTRIVRLFRKGRDQVVAIPRQFELPCEDVLMRKEGGRLIIEPLRKSLAAVLASLPTLDENFAPIEDVPTRERISRRAD